MMFVSTFFGRVLFCSIYSLGSVSVKLIFFISHSTLILVCNGSVSHGSVLSLFNHIYAFVFLALFGHEHAYI